METGRFSTSLRFARQRPVFPREHSYRGQRPMNPSTQSAGCIVRDACGSSGPLVLNREIDDQVEDLDGR